MYSESVEPLSINRKPNTTQNEHVNAICCRPEVGSDVISGGNVKNIERCAMLHSMLKLLALVLSEIKKNNFVTAAETAVDIDDSIKRKRIRVLLYNKRKNSNNLAF